MRRVDEQSHKDEMRAALRADFERLRARRHDPEAPFATGERAGTTDEQDRDRAPVAPAPGSSRDGRASGHPPPNGSWLARLFGRESLVVAASLGGCSAASRT